MVRGRQVCTLTGHSGIVYEVNFSPDGNRVVSGSEDNLVQIWDAETGALVSSIVCGTELRVAWWRIIFRAFPAGFVLYSEVNVGWRQMRTLTGHSDEVSSVHFSRDGTRVVSGSADHLVKIWDIATGAEVSSLGACTKCSVELDWASRGCLGEGVQEGRPRCQALTRFESVVRRCAR